MWNEREADQPTGQRQEQLEIAGGGAPLVERYFQAIAAPRDLDLVRGRVRIAEACRAVDFQPEAARGGLPIAIAEITEPPGVAGAVENLCVFQRDLARLAGSDRKHPCADQPLAGELDQRRIAFLANDRLIDGPGLRRIHRFAAQLLVALPE